jgi:hypothetical protein
LVCMLSPFFPKPLQTKIRIFDDKVSGKNG